MIADPSTTIRFLMASRQCELNSLRGLLQSGELVGRISQLVHMLQRERGTSNLFLCSDGRLCADELPQREQDVQQAESQFMAQLDDLAQRAGLLPQASRLFSRAASVVYTLGLLPSLRQQMRQRVLAQSDAMTVFNDIIRHLLTLVFEVSDTAAEPVIARALVAMFSFMQGKELAGQERAVGAAAFAAGEFPAGVQQTLLDLIDRQERCFDTFANFADDASREHWQSLATDREFERLRRVACTRMPDNLPREGGLQWFALATARIDAMKQIEDRLAQTLMQLCRDRIAAAEQACLDQQADVASLMAQQGDDHSYSVFIARSEMGQSAAGQGDWLDSDGVRPQLGRSLLSLVQQQARRLQALDHELAAMRATLDERRQIDRAKGLLMQHRGLSEEEAYKTLRRMAMNQNKKLIEIANAMLAVADVFQNTP
ncbi:Nitrate regulatory protein [Dickeya dianthicola]|uniref:ANTAR domain-containing protein n=2 Tax=Dickeya dianthicola TaxID=204039 RepID=A0AAP6S1Z0_9GAMM|nr:nitrate regulatory protein [Dickeya dianthicola]ATO33832.1 Response regulator NasT [Dickeya dianthicola RNS04.9]AYC19756.1 Nitrate regulatory protein [Dickeya dianthicola]MBI0438885.1 ANTAR domain-containing protein [Dickeya dianthicola]MBI0449272.1 ANTAR domain-containing protein [Dickeya dianthicola]MBI0453682.1 ANTAR domain-containing protein [Dickeya dianthicola]